MGEAGSSVALRSMGALGCVERGLSTLLAVVAGGNGGIWGPSGNRWNTGVAIGVTAIAGLALAATIVVSSRRGGLKSPWSRGRRKNPLTRKQWESLFTPEGKLSDGGMDFLKRVRSGGVDPTIRDEVWPFLLGVYELNSSEVDRNEIRKKNRKEYEKLRKRCLQISVFTTQGENGPEITEINKMESPNQFEEESNTTESPSTEQENPNSDKSDSTITTKETEGTISPANLHNSEEEDKSGVTQVDTSESESEPSDSVENITTTTTSSQTHSHKRDEDFATWQRIIRLDALRANAEWVPFSPNQASVSQEKAIKAANEVSLQDYEHLEPHRIYHASRLVSILEAYALHDQEIGYCQGMSDLLSPIITVIEEDYEAFWCFVGFMRKARHNFRLDEVGIRRQLSIVAKIIMFKDSHLYEHLEKLQAEDCFFVYRMVVVMFRRELTFNQTVSLWEVVWADQAANRAGLGKSAWGRVRLSAPPTDDLLLYAIAASVLQKRKVIIESYSSMDEIIRECNSMAGQLDVWKLLDDAHNLVATLHDKIE